MSNKSEQQSFRRRKIIEESAPQRRAEALASTQNDELSNIGSQLQDVQAATEMVAEGIEQQTGVIQTSLDKIGKKVDDVEAGVELVAESSESTAAAANETSAAAKAISNKLAKLSEMLSAKFSADPSRVPQATETAVAAVESNMPMPVEEPKLRELLEKLIPGDAPAEDAPFLPPVNQPPEEEQKQDKPSKQPPGGGKLDDLLKTTKKGFNAVVSVTDRIAGMLFKYTITAVAQAAKFAGMLLALVVGIDMIQVYFQYFMKEFNKSWDEFDKKFEEWGPLISDLLVMTKNVSKMFDEGNWFKLAEAIVKGMVKLTLNMADILMLGIGKLTASLLRSLGFDETADNIEGGALMTYQQNSGAALSEEDQTTLAKYQDRKDAEAYEAKVEFNGRFKGKDEGLKEAQRYGTVTKETAQEIKAGKVDSSFRDLPESQRLEIIKKRNETEAAARRLANRAEEIMSPDERDKENFKKEKERVDTLLKDPAIKQDPALQSLIKKIDLNAKKFDKVPVQAQPPEQKEETIQAKQVIERQRAKEAQKNTANDGKLGNLIQQVNVQKNNKTMYTMPAQTSIADPGMHRSVNVN